MKTTFLVLFLFGGFSLNAQKVFTEKDLASVVVKFHPVAKQAGIDIRIAKADVLASRSNFDPQFNGVSARKEFSGITYYDHQINELNIPTWYGIDLYAGTEKITGNRVNPEETTGSITYMGFSIQPLQNLLMDKRRAAILQAKNILQLTEVQRSIIVNDLLHEALITYWDWWEKHQIHLVVKSALQNAEKRFTLVKAAFQLGDRPAIDTLEAYTQVQAFQIRLSEAYLSLVHTKLQLSTFLWEENGEQVVLPYDAVPQEYSNVNPFNLAEVMHFVSVHPILTQYDYKLKAVQIDRRLAFQSFLPLVKLKYNQIGYDLSKTVNAPWFNNNFRFGVAFFLPLRLSEGRGGYRKAILKIENIRLERANKQVGLYTKVKQGYQEWQQTDSQLSLQKQLLINTIALQRGEETKFINGESSLFLINTRELKTIEAEQKTIELKAKAQKAAVGLRWSAGILAL